MSYLSDTANMSSNFDHTTEEAGPPRASWWLDASEAATSSSAMHDENEVMGFEEVTVKSAVVVKEHYHHNEEQNGDEDDDDLVLTTDELCRTDSFAFVATQAQANDDDASRAELIQSSIRYEGLSEPPVPSLLKHRAFEAEEFELPELGGSHDLEAARPTRADGVPERTLMSGWFETLSKRIETICEDVASQTRRVPYRRSYR